MGANSKKRSVSRYFRFSLRTFIVALTSVAILAGIHTQRVRTQRELAAEIQGHIYYDYLIPTGNLEDFDANADSRVPRFLLDHLGVDFFHSIVGVSTRVGAGPNERNPSVQDNEVSLAQLAQLADLRMLLITAERVRDRDLSALQRLKDLEQLQLSKAHHLTDAGVEEIVKNKNLRYLRIDHSRITDKAVSILAGLPNLESLYLQHNAITSDALAQLRGLKKLTRLCLRDTEIDDLGMVHVASLVNLEVLAIDDCDISSAGLKHVFSLSKLRVLVVDHRPENRSILQELRNRSPSLILP